MKSPKAQATTPEVSLPWKVRPNQPVYMLRDATGTTLECSNNVMACILHQRDSVSPYSRTHVYRRVAGALMLHEDGNGRKRSAFILADLVSQPIVLRRRAK